MNNGERWYPAEGEPNVEGRFSYYDLLDIPASKAADEERTRKIVVLWARVRGYDPNPPNKVTPENQEAYIKRFPTAWKAFQGEEVPVVGTPISEMPGIEDDRMRKFQFAGVLTIENLAALSDSQAQQIEFGTRKLRDAAIKLLEKRREDAFAAMAQPPKPADTIKRRGRPPKVSQATAAA